MSNIISDHVSNVDIIHETPSIESLLQMYLDSLSEKEIMAYNIAKHHLGTSFSLPKSNGFLEWKKQNAYS